MVISRRVRVVGLTTGVAFALYVLLGFFAVPPLVKHQMSAHVDEKLKHKLSLGEVKFNPFTLTAELGDFDLREASGGALVGFKRLLVNFQASSLFRRAWTFAEVSVDGPVINGELRTDGSHNFSALLAALSDPDPKPDTALPRLIIERLGITNGRVDLADRQAGDTARLRFEPIAFDLTDLSTLPLGKAPYKLTARTVDGGQLQWGGEIALNPMTSSGKLGLSKWQVASFARILGNRIAIESPSGEIDATLSYRASYANGKPELAIADLAFKLTGLKLTPKGATEPLAAIEAVDVGGVTFDLGAHTVSAERIAVDKARFTLDMDEQGRGNWNALLPGTATQTQAVDPAATPPSPTKDSEASTVSPPWQVKLAALAVADLGVKVSDKRPATRMEMAVEGIGLNLAGTAEHGAGTTNVALDAIKLTIAQASSARGTQSLMAKGIEIASDSAKAARSASGIELDFGNVKTVISDVGLRQAGDDLRIQKITFANQLLKVALPADAAAAAQLAVDGLTLDTAAIGVKLAGAKTDVLALGTLGAEAKSVTVALVGDVPDAKATGVSARLTAFALRDSGSGGEMARLGRAEVGGGTLSLRERQASVERIMAADGHATAAIGADGKLNWEAMFAALVRPDVKASVTPVKTPAGKAWKAVAKTVELRNFGGEYTDERVQPPLAVTLLNVDARARNAGTELATAAQVELNGRIKGSGQFSAAGRVNLQTLESDLKVKLADLSLVTAQPLLAKYLHLQLQSIHVSVDGRLRYNQAKAAGADLLFEGEVGAANVAIDETETKQPFLSLDSLRATEVKFALAPNRLEIPELRVSGLATKLVIGEDQSINVIKILLVPTPIRKPTSSSTPALPEGVTDAMAEFPISISRIRLSQTRLDFSDLTLRPQFTARMHELQGVITGVSTARDSRAQLELDARIDEFGSAKITGEINPFQPRLNTDVTMVLRNLEMTSLTPYSAKFAGYRIASGRLSMDLQYKIKNSALLGEHKIVLDKLELGERVESPGALNLPLELAIAILKDSDGRIDIGLPISGTLEDPQFSYGQVIWKAIGSLLTRIVTAPFRALAGLFGGNSETLGAIEFDAGADRLLPPEREKLKTVAEALNKRPQLKLTVKPAYASSTDRAALQSVAARRAVSERAGIKLQPGEAPGPIDYGNARVQQAIQALFEEKFTAAAARELRTGLEKAALAPSAPGEPGKPAPKPAAVSAADTSRAMAARLTPTFTIDEATLADLAKRRGDAIAQELREAGKVDPARLAVATPQASNSDAGKVVVTELDLGVVK